MPRDIRSISATAKTIDAPLITVNTATIFPISPFQSGIGTTDIDAYNSFLSKFVERAKKEFASVVSNDLCCLRAFSISKACEDLLDFDTLVNYGVVWHGTGGWSASQFESDRQKLREILTLNNIDVTTNTLTSKERGGERAGIEKVTHFIRKGFLSYGVRGNSGMLGSRFSPSAGSMVRLEYYAAVS